MVCANVPVPVKIIGTDRFGKSVKWLNLFKEYGLTPENIVKNVKDAIAMK